MAYYELIDGKSKKFWEIKRTGTSITTRYGRIGSKGQSSTKELVSTAEAKKQYEKLVASKTKKGYEKAKAKRVSAKKPRAATKGATKKASPAGAGKQRGSNNNSSMPYFASEAAWIDRPTIRDILRYELEEDAGKLRRASIAKLATIFRKESFKADEVWWCLTQVRADRPAKLLELAKGIREDAHGAVEVAVLHAIRGLHVAGEKIPAALGKKIRFRALRDSQRGFPFLHFVVEALESLPAERRLAIFERQLYGDSDYLLPLPAVGACATPELLEWAFEIVEYECGNASSYHSLVFVSRALGRWGSEHLPIVRERYAKAKKARLRDTWHSAIVHILADLARSGEGWDTSYDDFLSLHDWSPRLYADEFHDMAVQPISAALAGLPAERAHAVIRRSSRVYHRGFPWLFHLIKRVRYTEVWRCAFAALLKHGDKCKTSSDRLNLDSGFTALGINLGEEHEHRGREVQDWIQWCQRQGPSPRLVSILKEAYPAYDDWLAELDQPGAGNFDALADLAQRIGALRGGGRRKRIYFLRSLVERPAKSLNQIGGCPPGVTEETWPRRDGEPMVHLFTLDVASMPELGRGKRKLRALAFFLHSPDNNDAYDSNSGATALVEVRDRELRAGRLKRPPKGGKLLAKKTSMGRTVPGSFEPVAAEAPTKLWDRDLDAGSKLRELQQDVFQVSARVLGRDISRQENFGDSAPIVVQFDEAFVPINMGGGVMYVFWDVQYWER